MTGADRRSRVLDGALLDLRQQQVNYGNEIGSYTIRPVHPGHQVLERTKVIQGRYLNELDLREFRKSAVIGKLVADALFHDEDADRQGDQDRRHRVQGRRRLRRRGQRARARVHLPADLDGAAHLQRRQRVSQILYTTGDATREEPKTMAGRRASMLAVNHTFDPEDQRAIFVNNNVENFQRIVSLMTAIRALRLGRRHRHAARRRRRRVEHHAGRGPRAHEARSACARRSARRRPRSSRLVLQESVLITAVAGYVGLRARRPGRSKGSRKAISGHRVLPQPERRPPRRRSRPPCSSWSPARSPASFPPARAAAIRPIEALGTSSRVPVRPRHLAGDLGDAVEEPAAHLSDRVRRVLGDLPAGAPARLRQRTPERRQRRIRRHRRPTASSAGACAPASRSRACRAGREIEFTNDDSRRSRRQVPDARVVAPRLQLGGFRGGVNVVRGTKTGSFTVMGDMPEIATIQSLAVVAGRFINRLDIAESRKVAVIGKRGAGAAVRSGRGSDRASRIRINGVYFQVVGVFRSRAERRRRRARRRDTIFVPFTTFQQAFNAGNQVQLVRGDFGRRRRRPRASRSRCSRSCARATRSRRTDDRAHRQFQPREGVRQDPGPLHRDQAADVDRRRRHARRRRDRRLEHHADHRPRAHEGDRHPAGARRDAVEDPGPDRHRVGDPHPLVGAPRAVAPRVGLLGADQHADSGARAARASRRCSRIPGSTSRPRSRRSPCSSCRASSPASRRRVARSRSRRWRPAQRCRLATDRRSYLQESERLMKKVPRMRCRRWCSRRSSSATGVFLLQEVADQAGRSIRRRRRRRTDIVRKTVATGSVVPRKEVRDQAAHLRHHRGALRRARTGGEGRAT